MNQTRQPIRLFGARSPLLDDYLETCHRLQLKVDSVVNAGAHKPRCFHRPAIVSLSDLGAKHSPFIAVAFSPKRRQELVALALEHQLEPATALIDPTSVISPSTKIGRGSYVNAMTVLASVSRVGEHVFINRACNIGHHALVGDYASFGPGVTAASNIRVGECAVVGAGAVILPGVTIGTGAVVSAGTRIHQDIPSHHLAIGEGPVVKPLKENSKLVYYPDQE